MPFECTCEACGGRFTRHKRRRSKTSPHRYCSHSCQYANGKQGTPGPDGTVLVPLKRDLFAIIDAIDADLILSHKWHAMSNGYVARNSLLREGRGKVILMHRVILDAPDDVEGDHIDRNKLNNRRSNLRLANRVQNCANVGLRKNNTTGYRGVRRLRNRWQARLECRGTTFYLGCYDTAEEAARAFDTKAVELYGDYAFVNLPAE